MNPRSISAILLAASAFSAGFIGCSSDAVNDNPGGSSGSASAGPGSGSGGDAGDNSGGGRTGVGGAGGDVRSGGGDGSAGGPGAPGGGDAGDGGAGATSGDGGAGGRNAPSGGEGGAGATSGDGGAGGPGGPSAGSGGGDSTESIGRRCARDADCGPSGICFAASGDTFFDGGPAGGYCTMECSEDSDCGAEGSVCAGGLCLLGCTLGVPPLTYLDMDLDPGKCHGREELRCEEIGGATVCLPNCGLDSQCDGRACDRRTGVCVDEPSTGLPDGARCDPVSEDAEPCASWCIGISEEVGVCMGPCALGGDAANEDCGGLERGVCFYPLLDEPAAGDLGACAPACTRHSDCVLPEASCVFLGIEDNGYCLFGPTACPNGKADCTEEEVCTELPGGSFCLERRYPLGD